MCSKLTVRYLLLSILSTFLSLLNASDIAIQNIRMVNKTVINQQPHVIFDLEWKNAWKNGKNNDAVWIFAKFDNNPWEHPKINSRGHEILKNRIAQCPDPIIKPSKDGIGLWIYLDKEYRGNVNIKVMVMLDTISQKIDHRKARNFQVYGLEMVYIPGGSFSVGDPSQESDKFASFYKSDAQGKRQGIYTIDSEAQIEVGPSVNALFYHSESTIYNGDQAGPIPAKFPKGTEPFYIMKYELSQGQYTQFLNQMPDDWSSIRNPIGGKNYHRNKGTIYYDNGKYQAKDPNRSMNYISFTDGLAYTDWAGLRPVTELEYEKSARGPLTPSAGEFVWGTKSYDNLERYVNKDGKTTISNGYNESELDDSNRDVFGASYYWVMDLSGSLWEKVITIGNEKGRQFEGTHGDGVLSFGKATNQDWPNSDDEEGGFGYRGGGYYEIGTEYSDFNPHSPIGYRYYGSWSGGPRSIAYGYRAGRTNDE